MEVACSGSERSFGFEVLDGEVSLDLLHPRDLSEPWELLLWSRDLKELALEFMELRMLLLLLEPLEAP